MCLNSGLQLYLLLSMVTPCRRRYAADMHVFADTEVDLLTHRVDEVVGV